LKKTRKLDQKGATLADSKNTLWKMVQKSHKFSDIVQSVLNYRRNIPFKRWFETRKNTCMFYQSRISNCHSDS